MALVPTSPCIAVTATTDEIRRVPQTRVNVTYTAALWGAGLRPYILPVPGPDDAATLLEGMDGLLLARALGAPALRINSLYHQAIARLAEGVRGVAHAPDGVIEGIEWDGDDWWMLAAQWHPDELTASAEAWDRAPFPAFARAVDADRR